MNHVILSFTIYFLFLQHIEEREDYATLSDLIMTSDDEEVVNMEDHVVEDTTKGV